MNGYRQNFSRTQPGCVVFLVDQSYSMGEGIAGTLQTKGDLVCNAVNRMIAKLIEMCDRGEDQLRYWFDVGIIGCNTDANGAPVVGPAFCGGWPDGIWSGFRNWI